MRSIFYLILRSITFREVLFGIFTIFFCPIAGYFVMEHFYPKYDLLGLLLGYLFSDTFVKLKELTRIKFLTKEQKTAMYFVAWNIINKDGTTDLEMRYMKGVDRMWGITPEEINDVIKEKSIEDFEKIIRELPKRDKYQFRDWLGKVIRLDEGIALNKRSLYEAHCFKLGIRPYDLNS
jgi:hypothetical protein